MTSSCGTNGATERGVLRAMGVRAMQGARVGGCASHRAEEVTGFCSLCVGKLAWTNLELYL